jgi:hypothetical protein
MAHLFFSYAHDDAERLYPIHARMELMTEHSIWLDKIGLERGSVWENSIKAAIDDSYGVIFAVTKTFITRPFILDKEIPWAFERFKDKQGVQLFPILFDDVELPTLLQTPYISHLIDARDGDMEQVYAELKLVLPLRQTGTQPFVVSWPRLTNFKGRDQQLIDLHQKLIGEGRVGVKTAGLYGTGGIGKTQLAVEYAHRYRYYYPAGVYWINAAADWRKEISDCAVHVDHSLIGYSPEETVMAFKAHLVAQEADALLVMDNVADPAEVSRREIAPKLTFMDLCQQTRARLLLTTRVQTLPDGFEAVAVDVLIPPDAHAVLLDAWTGGQRTDPPDSTTLDKIAESLGYLPLALGWMTAALRELPDLALTELLEELKARGLDDLIRELQENKIDLRTPEYHDRLVSTALDWQINRVSADAQRLLALIAAYGEAAVIPLERLRLVAGLPDKGLVKPFPKAVKELKAYSLVESLVEGAAFRLHPLSQQYINKQLNAMVELARAVPHLVAAYRDPATLDSQVSTRGFGIALEDLRATQSVSSTPDLDLDSLARLFILEEPSLYRLPDGAQESYVIQQIYGRAYHEGDDSLRGACDTWLNGRLHLRHSGLRYPSSQALTRILSGHVLNVEGALQLHDGRLLSWGWDPYLRLWGADGSPGSVLEGHSGWVNGALQLLDGRILSWGPYGSLRLWGADGSPGPVLEGQSNWIRGVLQLRDERILSWGSYDTLYLWSTDGSLNTVLEGDIGLIEGALQLRDGRILSWGSYGSLHLWSANGSSGPVLEGHSRTVKGAMELSDGRILSWSEDHSLRLWEADGSPGPVLEDHNDSVNGALQLHDGRILSWGRDGSLRLWRADGLPGPVLKGRGNNVSGALQLRDGRILSWGSKGSLHLWGADGLLVLALEGHSMGVNGVQQLADGILLSWAQDSSLRLWNINGLADTFLESHTDKVNGALQLRDGRILSWSEDHSLRLWNADGSPGPVLKGHRRAVKGALQLRDGRVLSWAEYDSLRLWNADGSPGPVLEDHNDWVNGALQLHDGRILSWGKVFDLWNNEGYLRLWVADSLPSLVLEGHSDKVNGALQLHDGRILSWSEDHSLRLWEADGSPRHVLEGHSNKVNGALQLHDGRILSWSEDHSLRLWEADGSLRHVLEGHSDQVTGVLQLRDERILSWGRDSSLRLWGADGSPGPVLQGHSDWVNGALQLRDGRILSWGAFDSLRLWSIDGTPGPVLEGHRGRVYSALQFRDGHILSWGGDGSLHLWYSSGTPLAVYTWEAPITCCLPLWNRPVIAAGDMRGRVLFLQVVE